MMFINPLKKQVGFGEPQRVARRSAEGGDGLTVRAFTRTDQ